MPWVFEDGSPPPEGGDTKFTQGALKNRTYLDVTIEHPQQYFAVEKSKTMPQEQAAYVAWVKRHFTQEGKSLMPKRENPCPETNRTTCRHENVHHKGSSTQNVKSTCKDCGEVWYTKFGTRKGIQSRLSQNNAFTAIRITEAAINTFAKPIAKTAAQSLIQLLSHW